MASPPPAPATVHQSTTTAPANTSPLQISWNTQDAAVLQGYRRAYHLDTPAAFKNPLSHVVLNQGIGRLSPTMARKKDKRRVKKEQLALAVRKNFNAQAVTETNCIVDWIYTVKNQGRSAYIEADQHILTEAQTKSSASDSHRNENESEHAHLHRTFRSFTSIPWPRYGTEPLHHFIMSISIGQA